MEPVEVEVLGELDRTHSPTLNPVMEDQDFHRTSQASPSAMAVAAEEVSMEQRPVDR
jgi:hypothetical protein